jgi:N-methylhydantoinase A
MVEGDGREQMGRRRVYFSKGGWMEAELYRLEAITPGLKHEGPAIVESPFTTVVIDPACSFTLTQGGSLVIDPGIKAE